MSGDATEAPDVDDETTGVASPTMSNTKAEIVAAAEAAGFGAASELDAMTKPELLALWE